MRSGKLPSGITVLGTGKMNKETSKLRFLTERERSYKYEKGENLDDI